MVAINTRGLARISISSTQVEASGFSNAPSISADGRFVVFHSFAANLVPTDTNGDAADVFLRDMLTGTTTVLSITATGATGQFSSYNGSVSDDGRFIAFYNAIGDLANPSADGSSIFVHDTLTATTIRISENEKGEVGNGNSKDASISGDGRFVAFQSSASNLVANDTNASDDIFRKDLLTNKMTVISVSGAGAVANAGSTFADVSSDGRFISFQSDASNLVSGDTNGKSDIFLRDTLLNKTILVSVSSSETRGNDASGSSDPGVAGASISANGRYVAFQSDANNLVSGDGNTVSDVFLRDTVAGTTQRISVNSAELQGDGASVGADVSGDGRFVVFSSKAANLVEGDTNGLSDVFLRDVTAGVTVRLSVGLRGVQGNGNSTEAHISADGHYVTFSSTATNLVPNDSNKQSDVFRASLVSTNSADYLFGSDGNDQIKGLGGADIIVAGAGNDSLDGGSGGDDMRGGAGNDTYYVDNIGDTADETGGSGYDLVKSSVSFTLAAGLNDLTLTGTGKVTGVGNTGSNVITGNSAHNVLTGGGGNDTFLFNTKLVSANYDIITDFDHTTDVFNIDNAVFTGLSTGKLASYALVVIPSGTSTTGVNGNDRILYDKTHGDLYYDRDGSGSTYDRVKFAHVDANTALDSTDFIIV